MGITVSIFRIVLLSTRSSYQTQLFPYHSVLMIMCSTPHEKLYIFYILPMLWGRSVQVLVGSTILVKSFMRIHGCHDSHLVSEHWLSSTSSEELFISYTN